jgi:hypothetical protein
LALFFVFLDHLVDILVCNLSERALANYAVLVLMPVDFPALGTYFEIFFFSDNVRYCYLQFLAPFGCTFDWSLGAKITYVSAA